MKFYCTGIVMLIFAFTLTAQPQFRPWIQPNATQALHTHGGIDDFPTIRISEDFGPRQLGGDLYQWHGGIDYNSQQGEDDYGDLILALEGGTISEHSHMISNVKSLLVEGDGPNGHNVRYIHVFTGGNLTVSNPIETGGCILKIMDYPNNFIPAEPPHNTWAIIIRDNGTYTAYGPEPPNPPGQVTFTDENGNEHTLVVNTTVNAGDPAVPLGNSEDFPAHLHLEILTQVTDDNGNNIPAGDDDWAKDPLQLYGHEVPDYNIGFYHEDDQTEGMEIVYPGTNEETIQVHVEMDGQEDNDPPNRYDVIMNVDNVEIMIRKGQEPFSVIMGPNLRSEFSHGARMGQERINMALNITNGNVGDWDKTHMEPFAYAGGNGHHPRDDYYYADFVTRIHKDDPMDGDDTPTMIADCPQNARYNDGQYELKAVVTDVQGIPHEGPAGASGNVEPIEFTLDNFQPFIQSVTANINGYPIYEKYWDCITSVAL